jgi:hypothetical protein
LTTNMSTNDYESFLFNKTHLSGQFGFEPTFMPDYLFPFQRSLVEWSVKKGRSAIFADCGLGKTLMQLVWGENVFKHTGKPVLILTPLSVGPQTIREAHKFNIEAEQSRNGKVTSSITVTNYQQLHKFDWNDFSGVVCDESGVLKNFDGKIKEQVTDFMRKLRFRLLCTATAAPNDYIELGTSSEALGDMGYMDMLSRFFKNAQNSLHPSVYRHRGLDFNRLNETAKWRFRGHAERDFWRWVCSWARAVRKPSDLGFLDDGFILPKLNTTEHIVSATTKNDIYLFDLPAIGLAEQRAERSRTKVERCELAARLIEADKGQAIAWCHLNEEGHLLEKLIPDAVEVEGNDTDEYKEEMFEAFATGQLRVLVSKPVIAGFGLNLQCCNRMTFFPSHSFEQWYQAIRRCWRFGQKNPVQVDVIASEGESGVLSNMNRKAKQAEVMFSKLVELMNNELRIQEQNKHTKEMEIPSWL